MNNIKKIAQETGEHIEHIKAVIQLMEEDQASIPFIARYRKEWTGGMDEVMLATIRDRWEALETLEKRRDFIFKSIVEQDKMTDALATKIKKANTLVELEDLYLPYKPKRLTKATIAREKGLEPLAEVLYRQQEGAIEAFAQKFVDEAKEVKSAKEALEGARHIISEWINEDSETRAALRNLFQHRSAIKAKVVKDKKKEAIKFKDYFDFNEPIKRMPSHRILAIFRGVEEGLLRMKIKPEKGDALEIIDYKHLRARQPNPSSQQIELAIDDAYKRLLRPSLETEMKKELKERADKEAINVFTANLQEILLASPLGQKRVIAIDPGFRTGCKVCCLDEQGKLLEYVNIFPHTGGKGYQAAKTLQELVEKYDIEAIAIGNGTAGRETRSFVEDLEPFKDLLIVFVNESGASIYSASAVAREEFPDLDLTVRGAVSIGRRLQDPLAEIVKIDPKSIGVGQYQHDVNQNLLKESLNDTVVNIVNRVGVDVNTASKELLTYVSGLGETLAKRVVEYRNENGPFTSRIALKDIKGLGPKAFQQAAGFLRIRNAKNPLDGSAVHPESYTVVKQMAKDVNSDIPTLIADKTLRDKIELNRYVDDKIGMFTLQDIIDELAKPGRDPREAFAQVTFDKSINSMEDLEVGMVLSGVITNVTKFGAFVDIGVHQDGLVHLSQLANRFVKDPFDVVKINQQVKVSVLEVDIDRKRINLSMKNVK